MSLGYAQKLSYKEDVGAVGMPEIFDSPCVLESKVLGFLLCLLGFFVYFLSFVKTCVIHAGSCLILW
jgi:hypothetical protein